METKMASVLKVDTESPVMRVSHVGEKRGHCAAAESGCDQLPSSKKLKDDMQETLLTPVDSTFKIAHATRQYLYKEDGTQYLDLRSNVHHVGYAHPKVVEACTKQMSQLNTNSRFLHDNMLLLVKRLTAKFLPEELNVFYFTNSISDANDLALQLAHTVTGGTEIISVRGGYHGHLKSLRPISTHLADSPDIADYTHIVSLPDMYRGTFNDPNTAGELYSNEVKKVVEKCAKEHKKIASFIVDPIMSYGGQIIPPDGYLKAAFEYVRSAGGLCIANEGECGYGRVGSHFWGFEQQGVVPDIITIGTSMGNGHPVAAVVTTRTIADKHASVGIEYFNTFGGNPVSMATACAVLDILEEENLQENARCVGTYLVKKLRGLQDVHNIIGDVRGVGLLVGIEFVKDRCTKEPATEQTELVKKQLASEHKIFTMVDGHHKNVLTLKPPMCIKDEDVDNFILSLDAVLSCILH